MDFEVPGEETKKRPEAKSEVKSSGDSKSEPSDEEKQSSVEYEVLRSKTELKLFPMIDVVEQMDDDGLVLSN